MQKPVGLPQRYPRAGMGSLKNPGVQALRTPPAFESSLCLLSALLPQGLGSQWEPGEWASVQVSRNSVHRGLGQPGWGVSWPASL